MTCVFSIFINLSDCTPFARRADRHWMAFYVTDYFYSFNPFISYTLFLLLCRPYHSSLLRCTHSSIIVMNNLIKYQFLLSADNTPCNFHSVDTNHIKYFNFYYILAYVVNYCISDLVHQLLPFYYLLTTPFQYFLNIKKIYYSHSMFHKYQVLNMHPIQVAQ